jgi:hypothetical protein
MNVEEEEEEDDDDDDVMTLDSINPVTFEVLRFQAHQEHAKMSILVGYSSSRNQDLRSRLKSGQYGKWEPKLYL